MTPGLVPHESGLKFLPAGASDLSGGGIPEHCFGAMLNDPDFTDVEGFSRRLEMLDTVYTKDVFTPTDSGMRQAEGYKAVISRATGQPYSVVSDKYVPVQDAEVLGPLFDAVKATGLKAVGRIDGMRSKRTKGHVVFADPDATIQLLKDYGDNVMLGVRFWNSYGGDMSFGAEAFGVRMVCINYNLWGNIIGMFRRVHIGDVTPVFEEYEQLIEKTLGSSDFLQDLVQAAITAEIMPDEVSDLLWALNLGPKQVETIAKDPWAWMVKPVDSSMLNAWDLYNAVTAYATYRPNGGVHLESTEAMTRKANDLLTESVDGLLAKGQERREAYEEKQRERQEKKLQAAVGGGGSPLGAY